jgi:geranylgeranyl diphosphate synthase type II
MDTGRRGRVAVIDDPRYRDHRDRVERALARWLPAPTGPGATVVAAMRHAVLGGGKRLRPVIALAACEACGGVLADALPGAVALELVHTYSLVHDDLPAMDDDDLRRGRPTVHAVYGEAVGILAGDALHTLAFELVARRPEGDAHAARRAEATRVLAAAAGVSGMVAGQIADLEAEERGDADLERVRWIHEHKTGALLAASAELGGIAAGAPAPVRRGLVAYGHALGLAFQIADDVLDETATAEDLGKTPGKDVRAGKATYPSLLGLERSRTEAEAQVARAIAALEVLPRQSSLLADLARFAASRTS